MPSFLIELLQVSLGTRETLSRIPKESEWILVLNEMFRQMIIGVFADGLDRIPQEYRPSKLTLLPWIGSIQKVEESTQLNLDRTRELVSLVLKAGYKNCVLKGVAMALYYPEPLHRQCGDIDLWVNGKRKDVMMSLRAKGWQTSHILWHTVNANVFEDVLVEIHFHPAWLWNPWHNKRLQRFFESHKEKMMADEDERLGFARPTVEFDAVFSLVHTFRHFVAEGVALRHIVDYFYIMRKLREGDDDVLHHTSYIIIHQLGMGKFAGAMMWVLSYVCGMPRECLLCEPNEKEGRFLLKEITQGRNPEDSGTDGIWARYWMMAKHYPTEVLWMMPWKIWHRWWRARYRGGE
ncbi:MAG: nucleotidyltransferase family protein [Bacteroidaceae bacterium]|nr:nucleotidyltransferase family protein [Bacteroidaceae bacterium]